ncbi:MAG: DUF4280 domain-containing protein [Janthinobacterium lividum]
MTLLASAGAMLQCAFGAAPAPLNVLPIRRVVDGAPAATILDHVPFVNIPSFGACSCVANPMVAAATTAAMGVLTPAPCVPVTAAPWLPGSPTVLVGRAPALQTRSQLLCQWGGVIRIVVPARFTTMVP